MSNREQAKTEFEEGSGNVFADLGLEDANERFARAQLGFHVYKILEDRKLKQREIASLLGIKQPEVSHLMNGHFNRFTTDKLLDFLNALTGKSLFRSARTSRGSRIRRSALGAEEHQCPGPNISLFSALHVGFGPSKGFEESFFS